MLELIRPSGPIRGTIDLPISKSIANRFLILRAIANDLKKDLEADSADDIKVLHQVLCDSATKKSGAYNIGQAGTAMRFLTAYFSCKQGEWALKGSERMHERPIAPLVESLRSLGCDISFPAKEGYPPLNIKGKKISGGKVSIDGSMSSQFISALLLAAPMMENGITIEIKGERASAPYIDLTLTLLRAFGIECQSGKGFIDVLPGKPIIPKNFSIESDWSAASYYYSICAISKGSEIKLFNLKKDSAQGDAVLPELFSSLGVKTSFENDGIRLYHTGKITDSFDADFSDCPDIAQTIAVTCLALGIRARLSGLKTLKLKETNRILALKQELYKLGAVISVDNDKIEIAGKTAEKTLTFNVQTPLIETYDDHRMAMSFAPFALVLPALRIADEKVVSKSYPGFWQDLISLGFNVNLQPH